MNKRRNLFCVLLTIAAFANMLLIFRYYNPLGYFTFRDSILTSIGIKDSSAKVNSLREINKLKAIRFPTLENFKINEYNESRKRFELVGKKIVKEDLKVWIVSTPLVKLNRLQSPKLKYFSLSGDILQCSSESGEFDLESKTLKMRNHLNCDVNGHQKMYSNLYLDSNSLKLTPFLKRSVYYN